jgi:hypothetical protein
MSRHLYLYTVHHLLLRHTSSTGINTIIVNGDGVDGALLDGAVPVGPEGEAGGLSTHHSPQTRRRVPAAHVHHLVQAPAHRPPHERDTVSRDLHHVKYFHKELLRRAQIIFTDCLLPFTILCKTRQYRWQEWLYTYFFSVKT